ncbi:MAG: TlpA disulfide reductase family protein [Thermoanaerobaculia bacterium]
MNRIVLAVGLLISAVLIGVLFVNLGKDPQRIDSPLIGKQAPDFTLKEAGIDRSLSLASLRGKPVVVNFWATWCRPCFEENPVLTSVARSMGSDVQFVGVVFDDTEPKILSFIRENGTSYPHVMDEEGKTAIAYGVGGVPETFFIDRTGKIVSKYAGPMSPDDLMNGIALASGGAR